MTIESFRVRGQSRGPCRARRVGHTQPAAQRPPKVLLMELFARFRRTAPAHTESEPSIPVAQLPHVNQRLTVWMGEHSPLPSRVEDHADGEIVISYPNMPLVVGDPVSVSWEGDPGWYSLDTTVTAVDDASAVPTVTVSATGRLRRHDERRSDVRREIALPLELRIVMARVVKGGRTLNTHTTELSGDALRFSTSAPFAPGDLVESRLTLSDGEVVSSRLRVIRMDAVSGSWRQTCTAAFDDILRSDRSRIVAYLESHGRLATEPFDMRKLGS